MKYKTIIFIFIVLFSIFYFLFSISVRAFDSSSTNFNIRAGDIESISGEGTSTNFKNRSAGGQNATGFSSNVMKIYAGILYWLYPPKYEQIHFHWRNDDGNEAAATSATSGTQDTQLDNLAKNTIKRIRLEISNEGGNGASANPFRIEYGLQSTTCADIGAWTDVGAGGGDWDMGASQLTEAGDTTNIAISIGGVTDENTTFLTPNGGQRETTSQTGNLMVSDYNFVELEYAVQALDAATAGGTYCFRLTNAGSTTNFAYTQYAKVSIAAANDSPTIGAISLYGSTGGGTLNTIYLIENSTVDIMASASITDAQGCTDVRDGGGVKAIAYLYNEQTASCSNDNNNCYGSEIASCSWQSTVGNTCNYDCVASSAMWYYADPTSSTASKSNEEWAVTIIASDSYWADVSSNSWDPGVSGSTSAEVALLLALDVPGASGSVDYDGGAGTLAPDSESSIYERGVLNSGNRAMNPLISGISMTGAGTITANSQQYFLTSFSIGDGTSLSASATTLDTDTPQRTSDTAGDASDDQIFWGLYVPAGQAAGDYSGVNTYTADAD